MNELRERKFNLFVGSPGSGKSTYLANYVKSYKNGNVCVFKHISNYDDPAFSFLPIKTNTNWRQGVQPNESVKFRMIGTEDSYPLLLNWLKGNEPGKFRNGLLIVDDCTLFEKDRLSKEMRTLVAMRRHAGYRLDICLVYHGLTNLPIDQFTFVNLIVMFNTTDNIKYKSTRIPYDELMQTVSKAKANYNAGGKLKYKPEILRLG